MKKLMLIAAACLGLLTTSHAQALPDRQVTLQWGYPIAEITEGLSFRVYFCDQLPAANVAFPGGWTLLRAPVFAVPGQSLYDVIETVTPGERFYCVSAVNLWGVESVPSNVVHTPAATRPTQPTTLRLTLNP